MKLVLFVLVLAVSLSMAAEPTAMGGVAGGTTWVGSEAETVYWSQLPTGYAHASQYFPDNYPTYDAGVADDFEFTSTTTINKVRWWGGYWNPGPGPHDVPVEIYLYLDDGSDTYPTLPQHTSAIASWMIPAGGYTEVADGANFMMEYVFATPVVFDPNVHYWMEIRKNLALATGGQYGWVGSIPATMGTSVQGFDGLGIVWWTHQDESGVPCDVAFELVFDDAVALQRSTWADIKTIF